MQVMGHLSAYKAADEALVNDAALNDDDSLSIPVGSGETWFFEVHAHFTTANGTADIQVAMNGPTTSNIWFHIHFSEHTAITGNDGAEKTAWDDAFSVNYTGAADDNVEICGTFVTTAAGILVFRWAQGTSNAGATTVKAGSLLIAERLV